MLLTILYVRQLHLYTAQAGPTLLDFTMGSWFTILY